MFYEREKLNAGQQCDITAFGTVQENAMAGTMMAPQSQHSDSWILGNVLPYVVKGTWQM